MTSEATVPCSLPVESQRHLERLPAPLVHQMGGALGVELAGGPKIDMIYGRQDGDATPPASNEPFGLPDALPPFGGGNDNGFPYNTHKPPLTR